MRLEGLSPLLPAPAVSVGAPLLCLLAIAISGGVGAAPDRTTHPLMPGVRSPELWNPEWPRPLHDKQITGFSPLVCGMRQAPEGDSTIDVGGTLSWVREITTASGERCLLMNDGTLCCLSLHGEFLWTGGFAGSFAWWGDLRGTGRDSLLLTSAYRLAELDGATGEVLWRHDFEPTHTHARVQVADVLPDRPGMEVAVFFQYGEQGCLLSFPPEGEPQTVWETTVVVPGEHPERADHGCDIRIDMSVPEQPIIWNVRHHRCRGFDARTGEMLSSLVYELGGGHRRNYGPWALGTDTDGAPIICVAGEQIQAHIHGIRLSRSGESELAWQQYYGEVYVTPGVALRSIAIADIDGDGATEMVYNVRDPGNDLRSFVRVRDGGTGRVEVELPDAWCLGYFDSVVPDGASGLVVCSAPAGATPTRGEVIVYRFAGSGALAEVGRLPNASAGPVLVAPADAGNHLLLSEFGDNGETALVRYEIADRELRPAAGSARMELDVGDIRLATRTAGGEPLYLTAGADGWLGAFGYDVEEPWCLPLHGGSAPGLAAADLNGDGAAELVVATAAGRIAVYGWGAPDGVTEMLSVPSRGQVDREPLLYDLDGSGRLSLVTAVTSPDGRLAARALRPDGSILWETILDRAPPGDPARVVAWNAGQFLPGPRAGLAVSVYNDQRTVEGTYMLDGVTGEPLWYLDRYQDGSLFRGVRPVGYPTAFDIDGDGLDEVGMDMYSYMAFLNGEDGSFAFIRHTDNIRAEGALYAAQLYNTVCPVYRRETDEQPHWFVPLGFGRFGLMNPEPTTGIWREEVGYDVPTKVGMIDVDGDGAMEVGYALQHSTSFVCRDLWTGDVEWELQMPTPLGSPVLAADVDGDGKGEFLAGWYCIGTDDAGRGEIRWQAPCYMGSAIIADFDGDGRGEIACPGGGCVTILSGR